MSSQKTKNEPTKIIKDKFELNHRINFARFGKPLDYLDLLNIQLHAYDEFLQEYVPPDNRDSSKGLQLAFSNNFPIEDASSVYQLEFIDYMIEKPKYNE